MTPYECKERRLRLGISTEVLARRAGLAERTVKRFEAKVVASRFGTVLALSQTLRALEVETHEALWGAASGRS